jgi:hypothetical protein
VGIQDNQGGAPEGGASEQKLEGNAAPQSAAGAVPAAKRGAIYTMTAREGLNAAEMVNATLARKTVGKATPRRVEVAAPDGPSTSGGKRARQTIRLVPATGAGAPVMCGFLDVGQKAVELRGYANVSRQFKERFGNNLDITLEEYNTLLKDLEATFGVFQYSVTHEPDDAVPAPQRATFTSGAPSAPTSGSFNVIMIALSVIALVGVGLAIFMRK